MCKNSVLMRDVVCKYHPEFIKSKSIKKLAMTMPTRFNIEFLIEETLAFVGKIELLSGYGFDFSDGSDSKTTSVLQNHRCASIENIDTKIGALRVTCYNPHTDSVDFFYIPHRYIQSLVTARRSKTGCGRIMFYFNKNGTYGKFEQFRVSDFESLAQANY